MKISLRPPAQPSLSAVSTKSVAAKTTPSTAPRPTTPQDTFEPARAAQAREKNTNAAQQTADKSQEGKTLESDRRKALTDSMRRMLQLVAETNHTQL